MLPLRDKAMLLRTLAHPTRLAILQRLAQGPKCVTDIQDLLDVPQPNVSQHLMALRSIRVVDYHERGKLRCYYISRPKLAKLVLQFLVNDYPVVEQSKVRLRQSANRMPAAVCGDRPRRKVATA